MFDLMQASQWVAAKPTIDLWLMKHSVQVEHLEAEDLYTVITPETAEGELQTAYTSAGEAYMKALIQIESKLKHAPPPEEEPEEPEPEEPSTVRIGTDVAADGLANLEVGGRFEGRTVANVFTADRDGDVNEITTCFKVDNGEDYSGGNGGKIKVAVHDTDANGFPAKELAFGIVENAGQFDYPTVKLDRAVPVKRGQVLAVVHTNKADNPEKDWLSINALNHHPNTQPFDWQTWGVVWKPTGSASWRQHQNRTPIMAVHYADGTSQGRAIVDALGQSGLKVIRGNDMVAQKLEAAETVNVEKLFIRVEKMADNGPLQISVMDAAMKGEITRATIQLKDIAPGAMRWVEVPMKFQLKKDLGYAIKVYSPQGTYRLHGLVQGWENDWPFDLLTQGAMFYLENGEEKADYDGRLRMQLYLEGEPFEDRDL